VRPSLTSVIPIDDSTVRKPPAPSAFVTFAEKLMWTFLTGRL
jgi:hypothetical protein